MRPEPLDVIKAIRESFGASIAVYTCGNCYQFYEILKVIYPDAEAYDVGHVWTKIDGKFYDIRGEHDGSKMHMELIDTEERIKSLSKNKWTDERRKNEANRLRPS